MELDTIELTVEVALNLTCTECGDALIIRIGSHGNSFRIDPCETCLADAREKGREEGAARNELDAFSKEAMELLWVAEIGG